MKEDNGPIMNDDIGPIKRNFPNDQKEENGSHDHSILAGKIGKYPFIANISYQSIQISIKKIH